MLKSRSLALITAIFIINGCSNVAQTTEKESHTSSNETLNINGFSCKEFDKSEWTDKTIVLQESPVRIIAEHPCSDLCPDYTTRIVRYDVDITDCEKVGGEIHMITVPVAIAAIEQKFCIPPEAICSNESR